ncbi:shikimate kinase [Berryella wangjianweii]|uniref:shikimate kinase n=1 Tax=Berryella wangjianweii TaxID=2734634 RepID=UPI0021BD93C9|nr:shikimate kinase [Berryella wangjianweii]
MSAPRAKRASGRPEDHEGLGGATRLGVGAKPVGAQSSDAKLAGAEPVGADAAEPTAQASEPASQAREPVAQSVLDFRSPEARAQAAASFAAAWQLECPVFLTGFMGAGKTSTARKLARIAGVASVDLDTYLERRFDRRIADIFAESGEDAFRRMESQILAEVAQGEPLLVSCGGGVIVREENRQVLRQRGYVVYLRLAPREAAARMRNFKARPLFKDLDAAERLYAQRQRHYEQTADVVVDTAGRSTGSVAHELFRHLRRKGILWQQA